MFGGKQEVRHQPRCQSLGAVEMAFVINTGAMGEIDRSDADSVEDDGHI